ncbi:MAG: ABC transporter permease DevC [Acidobacteriota bacterium]
MSVPLAWRQLVEDPRRLAAALAGVVFAVALMLTELGFRSAMLGAAVRYQERLVYDLALISPSTVFIGLTHPFPRARLYQAAAAEGVQWVSPVYCYQQYWKNPWRNNRRNLLVVGVDPRRVVLQAAGAATAWDRLAEPDAVLFDALSRPEFGPVAKRFRAGDTITAEVGERRVRVVGIYEMGSSFGVDGNLLTSDASFLRLFPERPVDAIDIGLVKLRPGVDPEATRERLAAALAGDVEVLTRAGFAAREIAYWENTTAIGWVFGFGLLMGLVVGGIIVYQILFTDVANRLAQYATLRAVGWSFPRLAAVVLRQAVGLALLGFLPGLAVAWALYGLAGAAIRMPMAMTWGRVLGVLLLTIAMCGAAGLLALRKLATADPTEVFG